MAVIQLEGISLWRRTQEELAYDLKRIILQSLERRFRHPSRRRVLHDIELSIESGEKIGIIGPNGAGKSTLLKVICGILRPTTGTARVTGRIAPLIELGAGFDYDLSVIENILFYGVLLGFTREEISSRVGPILQWAELEEYGNSPLKALSSGMVARLGFSIATDQRPEILILDEILAVGDASFMRKSTARIGEFWDAHSTIIVVSHSTEFIAAQCERAVWLDKGGIVAIGPAPEITQQYLDSVYSEKAAGGESESAEVGFALDTVTHNGATRTISGTSKIARVRLAAGEPLLIVGWAVDLGHREPASVVTFEVDGNALATVRCTSARVDIAAWYGDPRLENCGFTVTLPTSLPPGVHPVSLNIVTSTLGLRFRVPVVLELEVT